MASNAQVTLSVNGAQGASQQAKALATSLRDAAAAAKSLSSSLPGATSGPAPSAAATAARGRGTIGVIGGITSGLKAASGAARGLVSALPGGAIAAGLFGLNGAIGFAAAAGLIIANSIRLAAEFNRTSTNSVLAMTSNRAQALDLLQRFKDQAASLQDIGIGPVEGAKMIGAYGAASGSTAGIANARVLGSYARAFGQDPTSFAEQMGLLGQNAGPNVGRTAGLLFGAAGQSHEAGARIPEFIGVATSVLAQIAATRTAAAPDVAKAAGVQNQQPDIREALREVIGFTKLGNYFATTEGLKTSLAAFDKLGQSVVGNYQGQNIARQAGWSMHDIILGPGGDVGKKAAFANAAWKQYGGMGPNLDLFYRQMGLSGDETRALEKAQQLGHGQIMTTDPVVKSAIEKLGAYQSTETAAIDRIIAKFEKAQEKLGEDLIKKFSPDLEKIADGSIKAAEFLGHLISTLGNKIPTILLAILGVLAASPILTAGATIAGWIGKLVGAAGGPTGAMKLFGTNGLLLPAVLAAVTAAIPGSAGPDEKRDLGRHWHYDYGFGGAKKVYDQGYREPSNMAQALYAWRMAENSGGYERNKNPIAIGAYQFKISGEGMGTLGGYARQLDPDLFKKLGPRGFQDYFIAHPKMQDRYAVEYMRQGHVASLRELAAYVLGGQGGLDVLRHDAQFGTHRADHYTDGPHGTGTSLTEEGNRFERYAKDAPAIKVPGGHVTVKSTVTFKADPPNHRVKGGNQRATVTTPLHGSGWGSH